MAPCGHPRRRAQKGRLLVATTAAALALLSALYTVNAAFAILTGAPPATRDHAAAGVAPRAGSRRVGLRVVLTTEETEVEEAEEEQPPRKKSGKLPSKLVGLSPEEIAARKAKALDIWDSMKVDVKEELDRYQTFRLEKFEEFMRADGRGMALFELYKPGTPEYAEFFEEHMGPYIFGLAQEKLKEAFLQIAGVILFFGTILWVLGNFGTEILSGLISPFTGFADQFVELYGF